MPWMIQRGSAFYRWDDDKGVVWTTKTRGLRWRNKRDAEDVARVNGGRTVWDDNPRFEVRRQRGLQA
jgi:hypothetical protein